MALNSTQLNELEGTQMWTPLCRYRIHINYAPATPASVWRYTGHTGLTSHILYTWPYYTPSKGRSNCPKR